MSILYEFIFPTEICLVDPAEWQPLQIVRYGHTFRIRKPVTGSKPTPVGQTLGNEGMVVGFSIFRVDVAIGDEGPKPEWSFPAQLCKECIAWIRVASRQYWLGFLMSYSDSFVRGSVFTTDSNGVGPGSNFGAAKMRIPPRPLDLATWLKVGGLVEVGLTPRIADIAFCDAQLSFVSDNFLQAFVQLGMASEIELNGFIDDFIARESIAFRRLYDERKPFEWKLRNMPEILGLESYEKRDARNFKLLCNLYKARGAAAHRAKPVVRGVNPATGKEEGVDLDFGTTSQFMFAVNDFLNWTVEVRRQAGLEVNDSLRP